MNAMLSRPHREIQDPPIAKFLFGDTRTAWFWLIVRLYVGWQWVEAGWHKVTEAGWQDGSSIQGYWARAIAIPAEGKPAIAFDWYRDFLTFLHNTDSHVWFGPMVARSEEHTSELQSLAY